MEILKVIFWIVSWIFALVVIIAFLKGASRRAIKFHTIDRYDAAAMLEKEIEDSNNSVIF